MPNRRRTARKLKRAINKAKIKVKRSSGKQAPNDDMMKLMALLAGKGNGDKSTDVTSLLNTREKISELQQENMRIKKDTKSKLADEKLKREHMKAEMEQQQSDHELQIAKLKTDKLMKKAEQEKKLLALDEEQQGYVGELGKLRNEIDDAMDRILEHSKEMSLEDVKREVNKAKERLDRLMMSPDYKNVSREVKELYRAATNKMADVIEDVRSFEESMSGLNEGKVREDLLRKAVEDMCSTQNDLIAAISKTRFDREQTEANTQQLQDTANRHRSLQKELRDEQERYEISKARFATAGLLHEVDANGNPIETQIDHPRKIAVNPEDDPKVKEQKEVIRSIIDWLHTRVDGRVKWEKILMLPVDKSGLNPAQQEAWQKGLRKYGQEGLAISIRHKNEIGKPLTLEEVQKIYQSAILDRDTELARARQEYDEVIEHNKRIDELPKSKATKVTPEMNAELENQISALKDKREQIDLRAGIERSHVQENIKLTDKKRQLEARTKDAGKEISDEVYATNAKAKQDLEEAERKEVERQNGVRRLQKMQDETAELEHHTKVKNEMLKETPEQKQRKEEELQKQINARISAEQQKELADAKAMTYNYERDERIAQYEDNARRSENISATRVDIAKEKARHIAKEEKLKQQERLRHEMRTNDELQTTMDAMKIVDGNKKGYKAYDTMIAQLSASNKKLRAGIEATERGVGEYEKNVDAVLDKTFSDPFIQLAVVNYQKQRGRPVPESREQFGDAINVEDVRALHTLFNKPGFDRAVNTHFGTPPRPKTPPGGYMRFYTPTRTVGNIPDIPNAPTKYIGDEEEDEE